MNKEEEFDYFQEVARSAFADMLFDEERNRKYSEALKSTIELVKSQGEKARVLDIGTGSGLLAMIAAKHGADEVVTLEAFSPTSTVARKVIEANGYRDKITLINKHSTAFQVGEEGMKEKANILVAELLDTELIGEGAIRSYNEAHRHLLEEDCYCVPHSAEICVQIVNSKVASSWFRFQDFSVNGASIQVPEDVKNCPGLSSVHDIQLNQLPLSAFEEVTKPMKICEIDFSGKSKIPYNDTFNVEFTASVDTESIVIFFWWNLFMTSKKDLIISCAPHWAHPDTDTTLDEVTRRNLLPFRDHWMQGSYFIPKTLTEGNRYTLITVHDEFSWFFDIQQTFSGREIIERPVCDCLFHLCNSRNRIMQMNDESKRLAFVKALMETPQENAVFIGDHSLLPLVACHLSPNIKQAFIFQEDELVAKSMKKFILHNNLQNKIVLSKDFKKISNISHVIAEPYFQSAVLSTDNISKVLKFVRKIRKNSSNSKSLSVFPRKAKIYAVPVQFLHLYKIRWPLKSSCEGFDHEYFDKAIERASQLADENVESFSLWEYPCYCLGEKKAIIEVNFNEDIASNEQLANIEIDKSSVTESMSCNGIAFWTEWIVDDFDNIVSTGPSQAVDVGKLIDWKFDRQVVHLIPHQDVVRGNLRSIQIKLKMNEESIAFGFSYNYE